MPWLFLAVERLSRRPDSKSVGGLALAIGLVLLGGHIQTSAHVLLAAAFYFAWRTRNCRSHHTIGERTNHVAPKPLPHCVLSLALGLAIGTIAIVPLGCYL